MCDAGGSTANVSAYRAVKKKDQTFSLEEVDYPSCLSHFGLQLYHASVKLLNTLTASLGLDAGGTQVDACCSRFLKAVLGPAFEQSIDEDIAYNVTEGVIDFRSNAKRSFVPSQTPCKVKLGDRTLQHSALAIKNGVLTVNKYVFAQVNHFLGEKSSPLSDPSTMILSPCLLPIATVPKSQNGSNRL